MSYPGLVLAGHAGAGKDTVGHFIADRFDGTCTAFSAPLKILVNNLFGFSYEVLYGESELRNLIDPWFATPDGQSHIGSLRTGEDYFRKAVGLPLKGGPLLHQVIESEIKPFISKKGGLSARKALQAVGTEWGRAIQTNVWADAAMRDSDLCLHDGARLVILTDGRFVSELVAAKARGFKICKVFRPDYEKVAHRSETELDTVPDWWFDYIIRNDGDQESLLLKAYSLGLHLTRWYYSRGSYEMGEYR